MNDCTNCRKLPACENAVCNERSVNCPFFKDLLRIMNEDKAGRSTTKAITNSCGVFWVDAEGVLCKYECAELNYYSLHSNPIYQKKKSVWSLNIPEGVTALPAGAFDGYDIRSDVILPETLTRLGDSAGGVFRYCRIRSLKLPAGITFVGEDAFFMSFISEIRISEDMAAQTVQKLAWLFNNHTRHFHLFYPAGKIQDIPPLQVPTIQLRNESGIFYVDKLGVLQAFCCSPENNADTCSVKDTKRLYTLHIPEGVTVLKENAFSFSTVLKKLTLPYSLRLMGTGNGCVLQGCSLPDVVIPETVDILGTFAFGCSSLRSLRLPEYAVWEAARQFKSSKIGTLYLSKKYRVESKYRELSSCIDGPGYLGSLHNVYIGEIVWLE